MANIPEPTRQKYLLYYNHLRGLFRMYVYDHYVLSVYTNRSAVGAEHTGEVLAASCSSGLDTLYCW